jgi:CO/xanthine dehydrogenase Mo-binding subunit
MEGCVTMGLGYALAEEIHFQGGGEPAIVAMGTLIANAIFDATGVRLFQLPMTPERVKAAIEKSSA